jgi:hypothetical protein
VRNKPNTQRERNFQSDNYGNGALLRIFAISYINQYFLKNKNFHHVVCLIIWAGANLKAKTLSAAL